MTVFWVHDTALARGQVPSDIANEAMAAEQQRREVFFSGHVQGVGFRFTTQRVAGRHDVTGFVRNLPDGRVHVVVEGQRAEIGRFLDDLARTMQGYIHKTTIQEEEPTGRFQSFSIRY